MYNIYKIGAKFAKRGISTNVYFPVFLDILTSATSMKVCPTRISTPMTHLSTMYKSISLAILSIEISAVTLYSTGIVESCNVFKLTGTPTLTGSRPNLSTKAFVIKDTELPRSRKPISIHPDNSIGLNNLLFDLSPI
jgi:hypothetical protein